MLLALVEQHKVIIALSVLYIQAIAIIQLMLTVLQHKVRSH
jgi:hypothetical protein